MVLIAVIYVTGAFAVGTFHNPSNNFELLLLFQLLLLNKFKSCLVDFGCLVVTCINNNADSINPLINLKNAKYDCQPDIFNQCYFSKPSHAYCDCNL
jgi:hypothetical protein